MLFRLPACVAFGLLTHVLFGLPAMVLVLPYSEPGPFCSLRRSLKLRIRCG